MYFQFVFCRSIYLRSISHATSFSRLLCLRPRAFQFSSCAQPSLNYLHLLGAALR
jgi:hypothetical protein